MSTIQGQTVLPAREPASSHAQGASTDHTAPKSGKFGQLMRRMLTAYVRRFEHIGRMPPD